jgi:hypothetical protein
MRNHVSSFIQTLLDDSNASTARTTLGIGAAIISGEYDYYTATGTDSYSITTSPAISAYTAGQEFLVTFTNANTTAATLQVSGIASPPSIVKQNSEGAYVAVVAGDIPAMHRSRMRMLSTTQVQLVDTTPVSAATASPQPNGTAAVGTSVKYAREDHVHAGSGVTSINGQTGVVVDTSVDTVGCVMALAHATIGTAVTSGTTYAGSALRMGFTQGPRQVGINSPGSMKNPFEALTALSGTAVSGTWRAMVNSTGAAAILDPTINCGYGGFVNGYPVSLFVRVS